MNLSDNILSQLVNYIQGENETTVYKKGSDLTLLFNKYGLNDLYDFANGGLPKLTPNQTFSTSRKNYTLDRLRKINKTTALKGVIEDVVNQDGVVDLENVVAKINALLIKDRYTLELIGGRYEIIGADEDEEVVEVEVTFNKIQAQILAQLDNAKFMVYVAVAWFTDKVLFEKLKELKKRGVNVQVVIIDDEINSKHGCNIEAEFESVRIPEYGYYNNNKMHHKYCVIDLRTVINGSYNWTNAAAYNHENIQITKSRKLADEFASKFIALKLTK